MAKIKKTEMNGLYSMKPISIDNKICSKCQLFQKNKFAKLTGQNPHFFQDNILKAKSNVLQKISYQNPPHTQAKLVSLIQGEVLHLFVDLRMDSETFGTFLTIESNENKNTSIWIPKGLAHGFISLKDNTIIHEKIDHQDNPDAKRLLNWDMSEIKVEYTLLKEKEKTKEINISEAIKELKKFYRTDNQASILDY